MSVYFDNIDVAINNSGIIATNASIESSNSIEAAFVVGYYNQVTTVPVGSIRTQFKFDYVPEVNYEPNFGIVNKIKQLIPETGYHGEIVEIGGIIQNNCFLENYSIRVNPNNIAQATASYNTFFPPCNFQKEKNNLIEYTNDGSIIHGVSTYLLNSGDYNTKPIYDFEYNIQITWAPIYVIGKKYPVNIKFINAIESINFSTDVFNGVIFSGEKLLDSVLVNNTNSHNTQFRNVSVMCQDNCGVTGEEGAVINLSMENFKINKSSLVANVGDYVRTSYECIKYY